METGPYFCLIVAGEWGGRGHYLTCCEKDRDRTICLPISGRRVGGGHYLTCCEKDGDRKIFLPLLAGEWGGGGGGTKKHVF